MASISALKKETDAVDEGFSRRSFPLPGLFHLLSHLKMHIGEKQPMHSQKPFVDSLSGEEIDRRSWPKFLKFHIYWNISKKRAVEI